MTAPEARLAILGGAPTIKDPFVRYNSIGIEEEEAALTVVRSGNLSQFIGAWDPDFLGGPHVRAFEEFFQDLFQVKHAVTMNSLTSVLTAAVGALGIEPGDEIITSPWTMSATAMAILQWNAIPVFADIEARTFNLDPRAVEALVTERTRAIIAPDIFGHSADIDGLHAVARKHGLRIISDTAQAPGARYHGAFSGTLTDIGGFSLNYHKHIHTGEGGVAVTNDDDLADRLQLLRNHAESVVGAKGTLDITNMIGQNYRMGEIEAAIGIEQLRKLPHFVADRQRVASAFNAQLGELPGLQLPIVEDDCTHAYYVYPMTVDASVTGVSRDVIARALRAEGVPAVAAGYQLIHQLPLFQKRIAYGSQGFPWTLSESARAVNYSLGVCPVAEGLHHQSFLGLGICQFRFDQSEIDQVVAAFHKVWNGRASLRDL